MTCQAVLLLVVVVEERGLRTMLQIEGPRRLREQRSLVERCSEVA